MRKTPWLQWTASPPVVADLDGDGKNEVIGLPNAELGEPYVTQAYAFMVLDGAQDGGARSAMSHKGFVSAAAVEQARVSRRRRLVSTEWDPRSHGREHLG